MAIGYFRFVDHPYQQRTNLLELLMLIRILLFLLIAFPGLAASPPAITVPAGQIIVSGSSVTISEGVE